MEVEIMPGPVDVIRAEYEKGIRNQEKSDIPCDHNYWQGRIDAAIAIADKLGLKIR
jgi:hypothetical protein